MNYEYSSCEWELLKRFSRSVIKGQGHSKSQMHFSDREIAINSRLVVRWASGRVIPMDGVTSGWLVLIYLFENALKSPEDTYTDLFLLYILDAVPPIHVVW